MCMYSMFVYVDERMLPWRAAMLLLLHAVAVSFAEVDCMVQYSHGRAWCMPPSSIANSFAILEPGESCTAPKYVALEDGEECETAYNALRFQLPASPTPTWNTCCDPSDNLPTGCTLRVQE